MGRGSGCERQEQEQGTQNGAVFPHFYLLVLAQLAYPGGGSRSSLRSQHLLAVSCFWRPSTIKTTFLVRSCGVFDECCGYGKEDAAPTGRLRVAGPGPWPLRVGRGHGWRAARLDQ